MTLKEFLKKTMIEYFIITTCITLAIAVVGLILEPQATFGYEAFFYPLLYGMISLVPALINYSTKELTTRQYLIRKALHLICIELLLIFARRQMGTVQTPRELFVFSLSVFLVYIAVTFFGWLTLKKTAGKINDGLRMMQHEYGNKG